MPTIQQLVRKGRKEMLAQIKRQVFIDDMSGRLIRNLSRGYKQRLGMAQAMIGNPKVIVMDEPTTGLHASDVHRLLEVLQKLVENGNTVLVIEHNLDVIKTADYVIDLGPEGGDGGGEVVALGTPEEVAATEESFTGQFLRKVL